MVSWCITYLWCDVIWWYGEDSWMEIAVNSGCVELRHNCWRPGSLRAKVIRQSFKCRNWWQDIFSPSSAVGCPARYWPNCLWILQRGFCTESLVVSPEHVGWYHDCWGPGPRLNIRTVFWIRRCRRTVAGKILKQSVSISDLTASDLVFSPSFCCDAQNIQSLCLPWEVSQYTWRHGRAPTGFPMISGDSLMFWQTTHWFCVRLQQWPRIGIEIFCTNGQPKDLPSSKDMYD